MDWYRAARVSRWLRRSATLQRCRLCPVTRIVVVSDTHVPRFARRFAAALTVVSAQRPDAILHCGDFTSLAAVGELQRIAPLDGVAGNNDGTELVARFGRRKVLTIEGVRLGLVHGDGVLGTTMRRASAAFADERVDAILFGHSHVPSCQRIDGRWIVNPGSPTDKRRQPRFSIAVLDIDGDSLQARLEYFDASPTGGA